jgi:pyruvate ferredoxin oxidoreductase gamma subunit
LKDTDILEIRFHGRGGQGVVTAAQLLVEAATYQGLWGQAIPVFGAERRGAPVTAFARISRRPLTLHSSIREPDIVVVLDPYVIKLVDVTEGLREGGILVLNTSNPSPPPRRNIRVYYVDATRIAVELGLVMAGWPLVNTAILGALARAVGIIDVESVVKAIKRYWPNKLGEANAEAALRAYREAAELKF